MNIASNRLVPLCWVRHATERPGDEAIVHITYENEPLRWTWGKLLERARAYQGWLVRSGVTSGQVCALITRHHPEFYPLYMGISLAGAIPAVLAYPGPRLHPDKFRMGLEGMARTSGLDWILTETDLGPVVESLTTIPGSTIKGILLPLRQVPEETGTVCSIDDIDPESPCLLQHSSGTTGLQKGVMLSHRAVLDHIDRYSSTLEVRATDRVVSWLPLYHDMGFIACFHQAMALGIPLIQLDPMEWVRAPVMFLEAVTREKGTLGWLPNFAYNLMADRICDEDLEEVRLDSLRILVNCSEPIRADSHERFRTRLAPYGLDPRVLATCYAMAETTFAVTQTAPSQQPRVVMADRRELSAGRFREAPSRSSAEVRACVSSGKPIPGCTVQVIGEDGRKVGPGQIGELVIRSISLFNGYRNQPDRTAEVLVDGWYRSGDLGFMLDGEVFVIGRKKDLIIVAGKNLCPEDIEDAVGTVTGILPGRVVAYGMERDEAGTEEIHVAAETAIEDEAKRRALIQAVQRAGMEVDVTISRVVLLPPRWLIKSSSGKISRSANKQRIMESQEQRNRAA